MGSCQKKLLSRQEVQILPPLYYVASYHTIHPPYYIVGLPSGHLLVHKIVLFVHFDSPPTRTGEVANTSASPQLLIKHFTYTHNILVGGIAVTSLLGIIFAGRRVLFFVALISVMRLSHVAQVINNGFTL